MWDQAAEKERKTVENLREVNRLEMAKLKKEHDERSVEVEKLKKENAELLEAKARSVDLERELGAKKESDATLAKQLAEATAALEKEKKTVVSLREVNKMQIERLKKCEYLKEAEVKALCERAQEIL